MVRPAFQITRGEKKGGAIGKTKRVYHKNRGLHVSEEKRGGSSVRKETQPKEWGGKKSDKETQFAAAPKKRDRAGWIAIAQDKRARCGRLCLGKHEIRIKKLKK